MTGGKICGNSRATTLYIQATETPSAIRVNIFRFQVLTDFQPRTKKGQPPHKTTGVASTNSIHCTTCMERPPGSQDGARSAVIASTNAGNASTELTQNLRVILLSSLLSSSTLTVTGSSVMPHFGQLPGWSCLTSGCMGQVYSVLVAAAGATIGSSAMPHLGQLPGWSCFTSGCMGQV